MQRRRAVACTVSNLGQGLNIFDMVLRPYQSDFVAAVEAGWKEFKKQLGVMPTGSGKTVAFSHLAKRQLDRDGGKTLIIAHRDELIDQAIQKLHAATGIFAQKEKADERATLTAPVVVASIQTLARRMENWPPNHFKLIICDEAHHSISDSWQKVLNYFNGNAHILGVTATADRGDERELGIYYENIAKEISLIELINQKYLSSIAIKCIPLKIDLSQVGSTAGDFDSNQLGTALDPYLDDIAKAIKLHAGNRKTLCFLPLIATSKKFVEKCIAAGIDARHIDGESPDRKEIREAFDVGKFQLLSNAMLYSEGYDCPTISCIVVLRATRSRPLFAQMVGRGLRIADGKENLLLLDFLWLHQRHHIVRPASLVSKSDEECDEITQLAQELSTQGLPADVAELMPVDLLHVTTSCQREREERLRKKLEAMADRKAKFISAEQFALDHNALAVAEYQPTMKWHEQTVSPAQAKWLEIGGINIDTVRGKGHASQLLDIVFKDLNAKPATNKQRWVMRQAGWRSADGLRGPYEATVGDAREFFVRRNQK